MVSGAVSTRSFSPRSRPVGSFLRAVGAAATIISNSPSPSGREGDAMSDAPDQGDSPANDLQFDRAEYAAPVPTATCRVCGQALRDVYYQVNGQPFCPVCRDELRKALSGGSGFGR